ncbi:MAG: sigma-54 dependent transcriptional regulator [Alphaproteobacteria bacterium]|nr:sigma-54 dependent transcriptional regulator [Alphaproteobacteria bacterium]
MTKASQPAVLIVEDDPAMAFLYQEYLSGEGIGVATAGSIAAARRLIPDMAPAAVVVDVQLPDGSGLDLLGWIREQGLDLPAVAVTAHGSVRTAVDAMRAGAKDFLVKPFTADRLRVTVRNILETAALRQEVETIRREIVRDDFQGFIGSSLAMQAVYRILESAAASKAPVFVTGESGTGKELCAAAVHALSRRANRPFITLNCAAIPKDLIESELFGHVKGAFTGATGARDGAAVSADGGTLFLDEIGEMDIGLQAKLLRFLQTGQVQAVGSDRAIKTDVRIVAATNRDPLVEIEEGRFREDLYYRLCVIPLTLPPLRDRGSDVVEIARRLIPAFAKEERKTTLRLDAGFEAALLDYDWPGNVRELQNVLRNLVVLNDGDMATADMLRRAIAMLGGQRRSTARQPAKSAEVRAFEPRPTDSAPLETADLASRIRPLWMVERDTIEHALALCDGNVPRAAVFLGINASTIYRKKQAWAQGKTG